jgi:hypothetical protein
VRRTKRWPAIEAVLDRWQAGRGRSPRSELRLSVRPTSIPDRRRGAGFWRRPSPAGKAPTWPDGCAGVTRCDRFRHRRQRRRPCRGSLGAARGLLDFAYITVGTGIGVGLITGGRTIGGFSHAEAGHLRIGRVPGDDWPGACAFHGDCVEGLASGPAIAARLGRDPASIAADDEVWPLVAHALAQLLHNLVLTAAPRRILIGGGVMQAQPHLFPMIRAALGQSLNGYVTLPAGEFVQPPGLGDMAGPCGGIALGLDARGADPSDREEENVRHSA